MRVRQALYFHVLFPIYSEIRVNLDRQQGCHPLIVWVYHIDLIWTPEHYTSTLCHNVARSRRFIDPGQGKTNTPYQLRILSSSLTISTLRWGRLIEFKCFHNDANNINELWTKPAAFFGINWAQCFRAQTPQMWPCLMGCEAAGYGSIITTAYSI